MPTATARYPHVIIWQGTQMEAQLLKTAARYFGKTRVGLLRWLLIDMLAKFPDLRSRACADMQLDDEQLNLWLSAQGNFLIHPKKGVDSADKICNTASRTEEP